MKKIDVNELKKVQLEMLEYFDAFCRKNKISYWLDYGTLLGAIRHKGYIPWDDDVDVAMLREDYEKAAKLFNKQSNGAYILQTPTNNKESCYPFGKLLNTRTVLYEYGEKGIKTSVYIDVFVYDNAPEDKETVKRIFRKRDFLGRIRRIKLPMRSGLSLSKRVMYVICSVLLKPISMNKINRALDKNAKKFEGDKSAVNVSSFVDPYDTSYFSVPKSFFTDLTEVDFEGKKYFAPEKYDEWLRKIYGNYMEFPPVEKRVSTHVFKAYYLDD